MTPSGHQFLADSPFPTSNSPDINEFISRLKHCAVTVVRQLTMWASIGTAS
jgi:hypothetical protein